MRSSSAIPPRSASRPVLPWLLIALVVTSAFFGQVPGLPGPSAAGDPGRECQAPSPEDADPIEDAEPLEDASAGGEAVGPAHALAIRPPRPASRRSPTFLWPRTAAASDADCPAPRPGAAAGRPASGRALRHWIGSQVC